MSERPSHIRTRYKHDLTPRQREVLDLVARGRTNFEIAQALGVSLEGAKYHLREIMAKLGVESREEAVRWWRQQQTPAARLRGSFSLPPPVWWLIAGAAVGVGALATLVVAGVLRDGGTSSVSVVPTPAATVTPCTGTTVALAEEEPEPSGARVFRVTLAVLTSPCRLAGDLVVFPNDPLAPGIDLGVDRNNSRIELPDVLVSSEFVGRFRWSNWCGPPRPMLIRLIAALRFGGNTGSGYLLTDHAPSCTDPASRSVFEAFPVTAGSPAPPFTPAADTGGRQVPACQPEEIFLALVAYGPHEPRGNASFEVRVSSSRPCRVNESLTLELLKEDGTRLVLSGNPAQMAMTTFLDADVLPVPFQWSAWCGPPGALFARVTLAGAAITVPAEVSPRCAGPALLRAGW